MLRFREVSGRGALRDPSRPGDVIRKRVESSNGTSKHKCMLIR
jgi:hypothetical protein